MLRFVIRTPVPTTLFEFGEAGLDLERFRHRALEERQPKAGRGAPSDRYRLPFIVLPRIIGHQHATEGGHEFLEEFETFGGQLGAEVRDARDVGARRGTLCTRPRLTGSLTCTNTIGISPFSRKQASDTHKRRSGFCWTSSTVSWGTRVISLGSAHLESDVFPLDVAKLSPDRPGILQWRNATATIASVEIPILKTFGA